MRPTCYGHSGWGVFYVFQRQQRHAMTGQQFREAIDRSEYSQRELAKRWGVSHTTIQRECNRDEVRGLYADAIRQVMREELASA